MKNIKSISQEVKTMTYNVEVEYKKQAVTFMFYYTPEEAKQYELADPFVGYEVHYQTFSEYIAKACIGKELLVKICLKLLQQSIDGVLCELLPQLELIVKIPNELTEAEQVIYSTCEKRFNGWRYNIY